MAKLMNALWNRYMLSRKKVIHGDNLQIYGRLCVHGRRGGISIGDNCSIVSDENRNPTAGGHHTHLVAGPKGKLTIGNQVGISYAYIVAHNSVTIEDNVLIGADTKIWDTDFHPVDFNGRMNREEPHTKPVCIREGAFIGACSLILKGVTVGRHSVVGAGSVVTHDIPDGEVWAGNPAKFIKKIEE